MAIDYAHVLRTICTKESGCNYQAQNPHSTASGAYQIVDGTWNHYRGFARAKDAPPSVQDAKALAMVRAITIVHGASLWWVPAIWYAGWGGATTHPWSYRPNGGASIMDYVNSWATAGSYAFRVGPGMGGAPVKGGSGGGTSILDAARTYKGCAYVFGGSACRPGLDCSGLTMNAVKQATGISLPHNANAQLAYVKVHGWGVSTATARRTPGALLFFHLHPGVEATHVAVSVGDGSNMVSADHPGKPVSEEAIFDHLVGAAVIPGGDGGAGSVGGGIGNVLPAGCLPTAFLTLFGYHWLWGRR